MPRVPNSRSNAINLTLDVTSVAKDHVALELAQPSFNCKWGFEPFQNNFRARNLANF